MTPPLPVIYQHSSFGGDKPNHPTRIVIHAMGEYVLNKDGGTYLFAPDFLEWYNQEDNGKYGSAHRIIMPDGRIFLCRNDGETAYHASGFNKNSLGMEIALIGSHDYGSFLRGIGTPGWVMGAQYDAAVAQCQEWMRLYHITDVVQHRTLSPGRKLDPGDGFPWEQFLVDVKG